VITESAIEDFEDFPDGPLKAIPGTATSEPSLVKQQSLERMAVRQNGRWCSIRVENSRGQCDILGIGLDGIRAQEGLKTVA
jgi:hypothetical protein